MSHSFPVPEPAVVWNHFLDLVKVPRPSKDEKAAIDFVEAWANKLGFRSKRDGAGNLAVHVPATNTSPKTRTVILQNHVDIVAVTDKSSSHAADAAKGIIPLVRGDFNPKDPKRLIENPKGDWINAPNTTLGADNGIGVTMAMALAEADQRPVHLQLLFTIDEEQGMTGAKGLDATSLELNGSLMINIDTEDDDEITVGSAGGRDVEIQWKGATETNDKLSTYTLSLDGLKGGHSGIEINQGRANANRLIARALSALSQSIELRIVSLHGGSRRNAIPDICQATIRFEETQEAIARSRLAKFQEELNKLFVGRDHLISFVLERLEASQNVPTAQLTLPATQELLSLIGAIAPGIYEMTPELPLLVESSCNLAIVEMDSQGGCHVVCSVRGTTPQAIEDVAHTIQSVCSLANASFSIADGYPGWKPKLDSVLLKAAVDNYRKLFHSEPKVHAVHAGLECGLLLEKLPHLEAISIGPNIKGNHAVGERVQISSVSKSYKYLQAVLNDLG